ncbi:ComEC/Rec2 family competence protein [Sphingomonas sabuli]|uniref:ComEC/Rec2 family competence protein n=1 Tax=Sphingomonas sabuli TaxID=2764186 RepID=UPI001FE66989|nr:ComEC/Rec2 family competence protein [Sphingomonas sabuli]
MVAFGGGIASWFALDSPAQWGALIAICAALALVGFVFGPGRAGRAAGWIGLAAALGCALVWVRSTYVAAPRLDRPVIATFTARVERVEPLAAKDDVRLTVAPADTLLPPRVRVSMKAEDAPDGLVSGAMIRTRARLAPPPPMALPGTYDFARDAWFRQIGGVGRAFGGVEIIRPGSAGGLEQVRNRLGSHIRERLPGASGGIATALATGDQNAVGKQDAEAMRRSGLTHLLSVSGLHIAAVVGAAMLLTLRLLALSERLALRGNIVLIAAGVGAVAGVGYTLLTGAQVPTVRSCIVALLVLAGIALGRDALSLRLLSVAALAIMLVKPESVAGASFQLSFAAVASIIALHSTPWARRTFMRRDEGVFARFGRAVLAMLATGLAVEFALIPFALFHFHKAGLYGIAANLVAIPLTTFVIMPLEAAALLLDSVGLGAPLWWLTGAAVDLLLWLARTVGGASGAVATLAAMPGWAFVLIILGGLWLALWTSRVRLLGLVPVGLGAIAAVTAPVPDMLVTGDGKHLAILGRDGVPRILRNRTGEFMRDVFAESSGYDGDPLVLEAAGFANCSRDSCVARVVRDGRSWQVLATRSSDWLEWPTMIAACARADIVVSDRRLPRGCQPKWLKLDRYSLARSGGVALYLGHRPRVDSVAARVGRHPWANRPETAKFRAR